MTTPADGATAPTIHPDWNTDRAQEHLADLCRQIDRGEAVVEALTEHLSAARREVERLTAQLHSSETLFSQPRHPNLSSPGHPTNGETP